MKPGDDSARKVRWLRLTLAGFGRYRYVTHFQLGGQSRVFIARNERGKSTFLRGLLYTLFGVPGGKRRQAFLRKYYNWDRPKEFWGRIEFEAGGETWIVLRDFQRDTVTVTVRGPEGERIVLNRHKHRERVSDSRQDPYDDLLHQWFGIQNRTVYEAIFCIDQKSSLLLRSQIDERIWKYLYGARVAALEKRRKSLYEAFRQLTSRTRDFGVTLSSSGGRNGRNPGRIEEVEEQLNQLRAQRDALTGELETVKPPEVASIEQLRARLDELKESLARWERWRDLQQRLLAVMQTEPADDEEGEKTTVPPDAPPCLQALMERGLGSEGLRQELSRLVAVRERCEELKQDLAECEKRLDDLRTQLAELETERRNLLPGEVYRELIEDALRLRAIESELERLAAVRAELEEEAREDANSRRTNALLTEFREAVQTLRELDQRESHLREEMQKNRAQRGAVETELHGIRAAAERARGLLERHEAELEACVRDRDRLAEELRLAEEEHERRFAELAGAPPELPMLWDRHRALMQELDQVDRALQQADLAERVARTRILWRRVLLSMGGIASVFALLKPAGILDVLVGLGCLALTIAAARVFPVPRLRELPDPEELRRRRKQLQEGIRTVLSALGPQFEPDPSREPRIRRLWQEFEASVRRLEELRAALQAAEETGRAVAEERNRIEGDLAETVDSAAAEIERLQARLTELDEEYEGLQVELSELESARRCVLRDRLCLPEGTDMCLSQADVPDQWAELVTIAQNAGYACSTFADLVMWVGSIADVDRCAEVLRDEGADSFAVQWRKEVWWALQNTGLVSEEQRLAEPPEGFDADEALQSIKAGAEGIKQRLLEKAGTTAAEELERQADERETLDRLCEELQEQIRVLEGRQKDLTSELETLEGSVDSELAEWLDYCDGDVDRAVDEYASWLERRQVYAGNESGGAENSTGNSQVEMLREESRQLLAAYPELVEALERPPEYAAQRCDELAREIDELADRLRRLEGVEEQRVRRARELEERLAELDNAIAVLEDELCALTAERDRLAEQFQVLSSEVENLRDECRRSLEARIAQLFREFSCKPARNVVLDDELRVMIQEGENHAYVPVHLSHGARDQLCLAVYLALADNLDLPFVFDDPFVNCDDERIVAIRSAWDQLIATRQLILLSHSAQYEGWAPPVDIIEENCGTAERKAA